MVLLLLLLLLLLKYWKLMYFNYIFFIVNELQNEETSNKKERKKRGDSFTVINPWLSITKLPSFIETRPPVTNISSRPCVQPMQRYLCNIQVVHPAVIGYILSNPTI